VSATPLGTRHIIGACARALTVHGGLVRYRGGGRAAEAVRGAGEDRAAPLPDPRPARSRPGTSGRLSAKAQDEPV